VTGVQTCALPIYKSWLGVEASSAPVVSDLFYSREALGPGASAIGAKKDLRENRRT
jgi:hypothetical protein